METTVNEEKLNEFPGKMVGDLGTAMNSSLVLIGDKLGLYRAIYENGRLSMKDEVIGKKEQALKEQRKTIENMVKKMHQSGASLEELAGLTQLPVEQVKAILKLQ